MIQDRDKWLAFVKVQFPDYLRMLASQKGFCSRSEIVAEREVRACYLQLKLLA
jgi:hypothetical protein